jgi:hypothetical protein
MGKGEVQDRICEGSIVAQRFQESRGPLEGGNSRVELPRIVVRDAQSDERRGLQPLVSEDPARSERHQRLLTARTEVVEPKESTTEAHVGFDERGPVGADAERPSIEFERFRVETQTTVQISQSHDGQLLQSGIPPLDGKPDQILEQRDRPSLVAGPPARR